MRRGAEKGFIMKKLIQEFREFIAQGDVMDLAVGIIIGGAFSSIVSSLVDDIITPLIGLIGGSVTDADGNVTFPGLTFMGMDFGAFLGAIINFLIISLVVFLLVKGINKAKEVASDVLPIGGEEEEEEAPAPTCPFCLEEIKEGATRCPHCGADLTAADAA